MTWRQQESAEKCENVQKLSPELLGTILELLRQGKTNKEIAVLTLKHRNTVSKYVNYLRQNVVYDFPLIINEILSKLQTRVEQMTDHDLIAFLDKLLPDKIEDKHEGTIELRIPWLELDNSSPQPTPTSPTLDNLNSTETQLASESSLAVDAGVKTLALYTKQ